jgi:hypothetical protein
MKTSMDYNSEIGQFISKKSRLVLTQRDGTEVGETSFDLSKYANDLSIKKDKFPLEKCEDTNAFIDIAIIAKPLEDEAKQETIKDTASTVYQKMPTINELQNEQELVAELEAKEKQFILQLENNKNTLVQLKQKESELKLKSLSVKVGGHTPYEELMKERNQQIEDLKK